MLIGVSPLLSVSSSKDPSQDLEGDRVICNRLDLVFPYGKFSPRRSQGITGASFVLSRRASRIIEAAASSQVYVNIDGPWKTPAAIDDEWNFPGSGGVCPSKRCAVLTLATNVEIVQALRGQNPTDLDNENAGYSGIRAVDVCEQSACHRAGGPVRDSFVFLQHYISHIIRSGLGGCNRVEEWTS